MKSPNLLIFVCLAVLGACARMPPAESPEYAARMTDAGDRYTACITREAEKDMKNPARAEDIALAAHGRCWSAWETYREAVNSSFIHGARTPGEIQFARDRSEGHLREFEREARRSLVDSVIQRNMPGGGTER